MLRAESLIVARLKAKLPATVHVLTASDLADVAEGKQPTPAVHVVYGGLRISQDQADGQRVEVELIWHTVVAVRNVRGIRTGEAAREEAGPLLGAVFSALTGHKLAPDLRNLRPTAPPRPGYRKGYGYYPLTWTQRMQHRGEQ
ncbi:phage tail terminator protein [Sedimenticola hydrogenitrophicus]|uniref:phage tail terminator protein n=1 Tax=Sedimenticola hydrogenitrophicus TaxID=2967975 RepID=UPI0023B1E47E|nr:hypothetical protein [Sedimenticola hydrogenitrophicus]